MSEVTTIDVNGHKVTVELTYDFKFEALGQTAPSMAQLVNKLRKILAEEPTVELHIPFTEIVNSSITDAEVVRHGVITGATTRESAWNEGALVVQDIWVRLDGEDVARSSVSTGGTACFPA